MAGALQSYFQDGIIKFKLSIFILTLCSNSIKLLQNPDGLIRIKYPEDLLQTGLYKQVKKVEKYIDKNPRLK